MTAHPQFTLKTGRKPNPSNEVDQPTPGDIRIVILAACQETGEHPEDLFRAGPVRARFYAGRALQCGFPDIAATGIAWMLGAGSQARTFANAIASAQTAAWWDDRALDRVLTALARSPE